MEYQAQTQTLSPPPPPPPQSQSLPKETASSTSSGKSRKEQLADYEKDYLARLDTYYQEEAKVEAEKAQSPASKSQGALPKGF